MEIISRLQFDIQTLNFEKDGICVRKWQASLFQAIHLLKREQIEICLDKRYLKGFFKNFLSAQPRFLRSSLRKFVKHYS